MPLPAELAVADMVWNVDSKEIAVSRVWLQHHHTTGGSFAWGDALQTIADKVVSSLQDSSAGGQILSTISNRISLTRVDAYQIGTDGKATDKRSHITGAGDTVSGSSSSDWIPSLSAVIQLWGYNPSTFVQHPRRRRGRTYAPGTPSSYFNVTGELGPTVANDLAGRWGAFMNDLQGMHVGDSVGVPGAPNDSMNVGVLSRTDAAFYQLEAVTVAYKPGWQHRRMNALADTRSSSTTISHS